MTSLSLEESNGVSLQEIFFQPWSQANIYGLMSSDNHICVTSMNGDCAILRVNEKSELELKRLELKFPCSTVDVDTRKSHPTESIKRQGLQLELCCSDAVVIGNYLALACGYVVESQDDTKEVQSEYFGLSIFTILVGEDSFGTIVAADHKDIKSVPAMFKFLNLHVLNGTHGRNEAAEELPDYLLIVSKFDEVSSCRIKQRSGPPVFEGCLLEEAMPEFQRLPKPPTASLIALDSAVIVDENCRVTVLGFDNGDLLILRTELSQKKIESTLTVRFDTPICASQLFFIQDRSLTMTMGRSATASVNNEIFLIATSALGPVLVYSEVDIITGRVNKDGSQSLAETTMFDCVSCVHFSQFRSGSNWKELLLVGCHAKVMLIYSRDDDTFNFVKAVNFPSPVMCIDKVTFSVYDCPVVVTATSVHVFTVT